MSNPLESGSDHAALQTSERRLRAIVEGMPVLMDAYDSNGLIVAWNAECERVTGYSAAEIINNPRAMEILYPDTRYRELMQAEAERRRNEEYSSVWELTAKDGTLRSIEWFNVGARLIVPGWLEWSIGIDITERRRLEAALREATMREQRRLGHELHDGLGQELTGLAMLAASLARSRSSSDPGLARELEELSAIASKTIATCKNIARGLAPVDNAQGGLSDALRGLTAELARQASDLEIVYSEDTAAAMVISVDACNHLFRIAQEALTNALAHASARTVRVQLSVDAASVCLEVSDDGRGIPGDSVGGSGIGLRTMRDRATAIRAQLTVSAASRGGTLVRCVCPNVAADPRLRR